MGVVFAISEVVKITLFKLPLLNSSKDISMDEENVKFVGFKVSS